MRRALVLVDDSSASILVVDRAIHVVRNLPGADIVLLNVSPAPALWQKRSGDDKRQQELSIRILRRFHDIAEYAGVKARCRVECGEVAEVATKIAGEEFCDHIFMRGPTSTLGERTLDLLSGLGAGSIKHRIQSLSQLPVTVVLG
jgi:nucleotide-binding universal stress UspA family protein